MAIPNPSSAHSTSPALRASSLSSFSSSLESESGRRFIHTQQSWGGGGELSLGGRAWPMGPVNPTTHTSVHSMRFACCPPSEETQHPTVHRNTFPSRGSSSFALLRVILVERLNVGSHSSPHQVGLDHVAERFSIAETPSLTISSTENPLIN